MKTYYIKDKYKQYWSNNGKFSYWSKLIDIQSIKNRIKYNYISAKFQIFLMKLLRPDLKITMEQVEQEYIK